MRQQCWSESVRRLGLPESAGPKEIQAAYKRLVLVYHPDVNPSRIASERFREIAEAYGRLLEILREKEARTRKYFCEMDSDPRLKNMPVHELGLRLSYSSSPKLRAASAYMLGSCSGKKVRALLLKAAGDSEEEVRVTAIESLGKAGLPSDFLRCVPCPGRASHRVLAAFVNSAWQVYSRALRRKCSSKVVEAIQ